MSVQGNEMHAGSDANSFQFFDKLIPGDVQEFGPKPENEQVPRVLHSVRLARWQHQFMEWRQFFLVVACDLPATRPQAIALAESARSAAQPELR